MRTGALPVLDCTQRLFSAHRRATRPRTRLPTTANKIDDPRPGVDEELALGAIDLAMKRGHPFDLGRSPVQDRR